MFGRRSHARFTVTPSVKGVLRVLKDVVVQATQGEDVIAIAGEAGIIGEHLTMELIGRDENIGVLVRVTESRPVMIDGAVRHRLCLRRVDSAGMTSH